MQLVFDIAFLAKMGALTLKLEIELLTFQNNVQ